MAKERINIEDKEAGEGQIAILKDNDIINSDIAIRGLNVNLTDT